MTSNGNVDASVFRAAPMGIGLVVDRTIHEVNDHLCEMVGFSREELIGKSSRTLYPGDEEYEFVGREKYRQMAHNGLGTVETRFQRRDGSIIEVILSSTFLNPEKPELGATFTVVDFTRQKKIEEELRTLKVINENSVHGTGIADLEGNLIYINEALASQHGYTPEELVGRNLAIFHSESQLQAVQTLNEDLIQKGRYGPVEVWHTHRDGHTFPMLMSGILGRDQDGKPEFIAATAVDISEMKAAEEQLRMNALVLNQISDQVTVTDLEGRITFINDAQVQALGFTKEDLIGKPVRVFGEDPTTGGTQGEILRETLKKGQWHGQVVNTKKDGSLVTMDCRTRVVRGPDGEPLALCGIANDISEKIQVEKELRESEERFRALHNASFGGIAIHDQGIILDCNQGLATMSGFTVEELTGMNGLQLISDQDRDMVTQKIRDGQEEPYEAEFMRKDGSRVLVQLEARNIPYKGKEVRVVEFRDLTEIKKAEAEQERLHQQLVQAQKMEAVGQLAGGIAHDFNNLLQIILGHGELALSQVADGSEVQGSVQHMVQASKRARSLVNQLLAFSRRQILDMRVVDLNETLGDMLKMLSRVIGEHIELVFQPGPGLDTVRADSGQLGQILTNLCVNSRDAMPDGGNITIATESARIGEEMWEDCPWLKPGEYIQLTVSDTGTGMDPAVVEQIFQPFFTTKEVGHGTGLGLSTVYGLVKQHQGFVHCESRPGEGTIFRILLPPCAQPPEPPVTLEEPNPPGGQETLLLAEDDELVRELSQTILERQGYTVVVAANGQEALEIFMENPDSFHAALLDVIMPGMSGKAVFEEMRKIRGDLPVLFFSGYSLDDLTAEYVQEEGLVLLSKPISQPDLLRGLRQVLDGRNSQK